MLKKAKLTADRQHWSLTKWTDWPLTSCVFTALNACLFPDCWHLTWRTTPTWLHLFSSGVHPVSETSSKLNLLSATFEPPLQLLFMTCGSAALGFHLFCLNLQSLQHVYFNFTQWLSLIYGSGLNLRYGTDITLWPCVHLPRNVTQTAITVIGLLGRVLVASHFP